MTNTSNSNTFRVVLSSFAALFFSMTLSAQNLIINPEAELDPASNGWTILSGNWASASYIAPQKGLYHFSAEIAPGTAELYQDIDVSSMANDIDNGYITFEFTGYMSTWNGMDQGRIIIEYRDVSNTVLSSYDTGLQVPTSWTLFANSQVAIAGTRTVRVRLTSTRNQGDYNDGYFDNLELYAITSPLTSNVFPLYGNVGVGTNNPDAKLAVNGDIHSQEVKVDPNNWPDYVFEDAYELPTLKSVEKHIKEEGHLPNIPKASVVEKEGIELGKMNAKLLEKIEELTLYTITQEKHLGVLQDSSKTVDKRLKDLTKKVDGLEKIVNKHHRTKEH